MMENQAHNLTVMQDRKQSVKCVVWDLDNTVWDGILLESDAVRLRPGVPEVIKTLDERGILNSIASRNDPQEAMAKLREFELQDYFLYPQINWSSKASSIESIAAAIDISLDTFAFVDDDPFERDEIAFSHPGVLCIDAADLDRMVTMPELMPDLITDDSKLRRLMYLSEARRKDAEALFVGPKEEFLATLELVFSMWAAREDDLERAEELTVRTHQLNSTGSTYSFRELNQFRQSHRHKLLIACLKDKFGSYGRIGLALLECDEHIWTIKLLLMSCRVISRGVGTIMLGKIMEWAKEAGAVLRAEFVSNERNRMMYITYKFAGFKELARNGDFVLLENDLTRIHHAPAYVKIL